jgi:hypothetical protein
MKTKTLLMLCLLAGMSCTPLSAQNGQNGTNGSYSEHFISNFMIPVFCDGVQVDLLDSPLDWHHIGHYHKGVWLWCYVQLSGQAVSTSGSGEIFKVMLIGKQDNNIQSNGEWLFVSYLHVNLKGNMGHNYIATFIMDYTGGVELIKAVCK